MEDVIQGELFVCICIKRLIYVVDFIETLYIYVIICSIGNDSFTETLYIHRDIVYIESALYI